VDLHTEHILISCTGVLLAGHNGVRTAHDLVPVV
jgi:hypothetical protein